MAIPDVPNLPPQNIPVMIVQASQAQQDAANVDRAVGICRMISNPREASKTGQNLLSPVAMSRGYFNSFEHRALTGVSKVTVLQKPVHGTLEDLGTLASDQFGNVIRDTGERKYYYHPEVGYVGQDSVTLQVDMGGYRVKVTYFLHVLGYAIEDDIPLTEEMCPNGAYMWKISTVPDTGTLALGSSVQSRPGTVGNVASLLSGNRGITLNIADFPGAAP